MTLTRVFQQKNLFFGAAIIFLITLIAVFAPMLEPVAIIVIQDSLEVSTVFPCL